MSQKGPSGSVGRIRFSSRRRTRFPIRTGATVSSATATASWARRAIASKHGVNPFQIALAWLLRKPGIIAIPKAGRPEHVRDNHRALSIELDGEDLRRIEAKFPALRVS